MENFTIPKAFQAMQFEQDMAELLLLFQELNPSLASCLCQGPFFVPLQDHSPSLHLSLNKKIIVMDRNTQSLGTIPVLKNKNVHLYINYDH